MKLLVFKSILLLTQINLQQCDNLTSAQRGVYINNLNTTWKASETPNYGSFMQVDESELDPPPFELSSTRHKVKISRKVIPEHFDAREKWPNCESIKTIGIQGKCGSCWAYSTVNAMSDRICIATNGAEQVSLSVETLIDCCVNCYRIDGCKSGYKEFAWAYWSQEGIPSEDCKPYTRQNQQAGVFVDQDCKKSCETDYPNEWQNDLFYGGSIYKLNSIEELQRDIMENGPLVLSYRVHQDFLNYKNGIYHHATGRDLGNHAVRVIGWGTENETAYWLLANSWGSGWGEGGFFRIRRGTNECNIENFRKLYTAKFKQSNNFSESLIINRSAVLFAVVAYFCKYVR